MDPAARRSLVLTALLTVGVMGGVVVAALRNRAASGERGPTDRAGGEPVGTRPGADALPPECLPDEANPSACTFDLPDGRTLDLGAVRQGLVLERDVVVRNTGRGVLCLPQEPLTGCGCVRASWVGPARLPPGATGIVRLAIDTKGKEGHIDKDVSLLTNEPGRRKAEFRVRFEVRLGILVAHSPTVTLGHIVYFGRHSPGRPGTAVIRLKSQKDAPEWSVRDVVGTKTKLAWTAAAVEPADPLFRHVDVTVTHPGSEQLDLNDEPFRILTTHPDRPEIAMTGQLYVARRFYSSPPSLRFGFVDGGTTPTPRVVTLFPGEEGTSFVVTKAEIVGEGFQAASPVDRGREGWQIEIRYDGKRREKGPVAAKLVVHVDDAEMPRVEIPIHADIRG